MRQVQFPLPLYHFRSMLRIFASFIHEQFAVQKNQAIGPDAGVMASSPRQSVPIGQFIFRKTQDNTRITP